MIAGWPDGMGMCKDGLRRSSVDSEIPVERMPPWANPGWLDEIAGPFKRPVFSKEITCGPCDVRWRTDAGTVCFNCGEDVRARDQREIDRLNALYDERERERVT